LNSISPIFKNYLSLLKNKRILVPCLLILFLFLLAPISLHQINNKIEQFLNLKSQTLVRNLEERLGLEIQWEKLDIQIFRLQIHLKNVRLKQTGPTSRLKPHKFTTFLNGVQQVQSITIRPSLHSLVFKKDIRLSKVLISGGNLQLKSINWTFTKAKTSKSPFDLPIKTLIINNTNLIIQHTNHILKLSDMDWKLQQKGHRSYYFKGQIPQTYINQETPFLLKTTGQINNKQIIISKLNLSNKTLNSTTDLLEILFNSQGFHQLKIKSQGHIPLSFIHQMTQFFDSQSIDRDSQISYRINLEWNKQNQYKGDFDLKSSHFIFKKKKYHSFVAKGKFVNKTVVINEGFLKIDSNSRINIDKIKIGFAAQLPIRYDLSLRAKQVKLSTILRDLMSIHIPLKADLNGPIKCRGNKSSDIECNLNTSSSQIHLLHKNKKTISFYNMNTNVDIKLQNQKLLFKANLQKQNSTLCEISGDYNLIKKQIQLKSSGSFKLGQDVIFDIYPYLKGDLKLTGGVFHINRNQFTATGLVYSQLLKIKNYTLKNISSQVTFKDQKISFNQIKANPGKSNYSGSYVIDTKNKESRMQVHFSFIDIQDIKEATQPNIKWPFLIKGTGTGSLSLTYPWHSKNQISFELKGDLFHTHIQKEHFKHINLYVSSQKGKKFIHQLSLRKGTGLIFIKGDVTKNLNLNLTSQNLPLESLNFLNHLLPFKQSGLLDLDLMISGSVDNPKVSGDIHLSKSFLYTFPLDNTRVTIEMNKKGLLISGNLMNQFLIKRFYYPFTKNTALHIKGTLLNFDFIKILAAKYQKDLFEKYQSTIKGNVDLRIHASNKTLWNGHIKISEFLLSKGNQWITNTNPFLISFSTKAWMIQPVSFIQNQQKKLQIQKADNNQMLIKGQSSLGLISIFFPALRKLDGNMQLSITTNRNLRNWLPKGHVEIQNGHLALPIFPDFTNISASLYVDQSRISIVKLNSSIDSGSAVGSGFVVYNFKHPPKVNTSFTFSNINLNVPKDFLTQGNGALKITGTQYPYLLSGHYNIHSGTIIKNFSNTSSNIMDYYTLLEPKKSQSNSPFELQLYIKTQQPVELKNSVLKASIVGESRIVGSARAPLLTGEFNLPNIKEDHVIRFRDQEFQIISGDVRFKNSPADNPFINIKAQTLFQEQTLDTLTSTDQNQNTEYKIFLNVNGLAKNLTFSLNSSPSLDEKELISMLTFGMKSKDFDAHVKENVTDYSYHLLGSFLLQQSLNKEFKNKLGFDLTISPQINVLNEPVTKIALKKIWFNKLKTSFSRTIEEFPESDVRLKYNLNNNISLTAFWENTEHIEVDSSEKQKMGLDLELAVDF